MGKTKILYVEDNELNRLLVRRLLEPHGYQVIEATDGITGVKMAESELPDLILMDINLPLMDGHAATTRIKSLEKLSQVPIIAVTSNAMEGDRERSLIAGCDGYIKKPIDVDTFADQISRYMKGDREKVKDEDGEVYYREYSAKLVNKLQKHIEELEAKNRMIEKQSKEMQDAYMGIILSFVHAVEEKHAYTAGHSARVRAYSLKIGEKLRLSLEEMENLTQGALLHDIGKLVVEISSLRNADNLTDEEWTEMKKHPEIGYRILKPIKFLAGMINIVHQHHERWDGKGYPQGLKGGEIDFLASIVAVADSYDAMTTERGYNRIFTIDEAMHEFRRCSGTYYNPDVVDAFLEVLHDMKSRKTRQVRPVAAVESAPD